MPQLTALAKAFLRDRTGLTALEYGLIGSILFGIIMAGFTVLATSLSDTFERVGNTM